LTFPSRQAFVMLGYSVVSLAVNRNVLVKLTKYRRCEFHGRASYICSRADVLANVAVFIWGAIVLLTGYEPLKFCTKQASLRSQASRRDKRLYVSV
jgi:Co/Zn/Cd efflux system component